MDKLYPLTPPQYNIYTREISHPKTDINNLYFVMTIDGEIDVSAMSRALDMFLENCDGARTRITKRGEDVFQYAAPHTSFHAELIDFSGVSREQYERTLESFGQKYMGFFDCPLFDFKIIKFSQTSYGVYCLFHHIWCDGWATGLVWTSILEIYSAILNGTQIISSDGGIEAFQTGNEYSSDDEDYWADYFANLELSDTYLSNDERTCSLARRRVFYTDEAFSLQVKNFCCEHGIKPHIFFSAILTLYHYSANPSPDIVMGMLRMNRETREKRDTVGMCVADASVRISPTPEMDFLTLCSELSEQAARSAKHKKYPFYKVVERVSGEQGLQRNMQDFTISFQKTRILSPQGVPSVSMWFGSPAHIADHLIMHVLDLFDGCFTIFYDYKTSLYEARQIEFLHESIKKLANDVCKNPTIGEVNLLSDSEIEFLKSLENTGDVSSDCTVLKMFADMVALHPERPAITDGDESFTYKELDIESDKIAAFLVKGGVEFDDIVLIKLTRKSIVLSTMLGILKAGGGFCCIDPKFPEDRLKYIISDSNSKFVMNDEMYARALEVNARPLNVPVSGKNICYAIYTSGTTGVPKGVLVHHAVLAANCLPNSSEMLAGFCEKTRVTLSITSLSFDVSLMELFYSICNGKSVIMATHDELNDINSLAAKMEKYSVNAVVSTPSRLLYFTENPNFARAMENVDVVISTGEAFMPAVYDKILSLNAGCLIYNAYGPSETFVTTTETAHEGAVGIGKGVRGYKLFVLDKQNRRVPYGRCGELLVGGVGVSRGYHNLPKENAKKYVEFEGERLYNTGDIVKFCADASFEYYGRRDSQIKLRGFRIELGEIEHVMGEFEGVVSCAVRIKETDSNKFLVGYYTENTPINKGELKMHMQSKLPYYMVPSAFVRLADMPLNLSGKVDSRALAGIEVQFETSQKPPQTYSQDVLCTIFARVLGLESLGIDDNFFELGGDSLLAAKLIVECSAHDFSFTYADIFERPTIELLTAGEAKSHHIEHGDYTQIDALINVDYPMPEKKEYKNVLLTGATGFLGLHVLYELLEGADCKIYCPVRLKGRLEPSRRLTSMLFYYFSKSYEKEIGTRIFVPDGDICDSNIFSESFEHPIDLIIHCAADVSHYSYGEAMYNVNVGGVKNLLSFAKEKNAKFVHISTPAVGMFVEKTSSKTALDEHDFYFGQNLQNAYAGTKFLAERAVFDALCKGMNANIIRVGNLQGRYSDGEFQINQQKNAFLSGIKLQCKLKAIPEEIYESSVDLSPVDLTAKAIVLLSFSDAKQPIMHAFNSYRTPYKSIIEVLGELSYQVVPMNAQQYEAHVKHSLSDEDMREQLSDLAVQLTESKSSEKVLDYVSPLTLPILKHFGFDWQNTDKDYLGKALSAVIGLGLLDV